MCVCVCVCREITEFGRNIEFPPSWHGTDRNNLCVWYHCLPYLKVAEFQPGQVITRNGNMGQHAFWILEGKCTATRICLCHTGLALLSLDLACVSLHGLEIAWGDHDTSVCLCPGPDYMQARRRFSQTRRCKKKRTEKQQKQPSAQPGKPPKQPQPRPPP